MFVSKQEEVLVVTIDGPAGTGKSTVRDIVATTFFQDGRRLHQLNSGMLYRACAWNVLQEGKESDEGGWVRAAQNLRITLSGDEVFFEGVDVTAQCKNEEISLFASRISAHPEVRSALKNHQLSFREAPGLVADGRDMGDLFIGKNVVRFFLTASPREQAARVVRRAIGMGKAANFDTLFREIMQRDMQDMNRPVSPLRPHSSAIVIDTDKLTAIDVARIIVSYSHDLLGL